MYEIEGPQRRAALVDADIESDLSMDAAEYHEIRERLRIYAEEALLDFVATFPYERLIRIRDDVT